MKLNSRARRGFAAALLLLGLAGPALSADPQAYVPSAVAVASGVYAIVGPLGQRSSANAGLNANYGFIVSDAGVILIDSGASAYSAAMLQRAVEAVTAKPIRWVLNTGAQDHRWLGNDYFARQGAQVHALAATVRTQQSLAQQQLAAMTRFVGAQIADTQASHATVIHNTSDLNLSLGAVTLRWVDTSAHFPGDALIYLPQTGVVFTGDLVYVDRLLAVLPQSSVRKASAAFERLRALAPRHVVPGHGRVTDMAQAQKETGDYYTFLIDKIGAAARAMEPLSETLDRFAEPAQFRHLKNFDELHRGNMSRVFVDFESNP